MNAEYSVEEVRNAARLLDGLSRRMLNDHAARIEADESAVPDGYTAMLSDGKRYWSDKPGEYGDWQPYFLSHPPAQVDEVESRLAAANALLRLCAGNVSNPLVLAIQNHLQGTAEPVAQGEADLCDCDADKYNKLHHHHHADCAALAAQPRTVPEGWRETILSVLSALDVATRDSDPNIDPDMNDDEVREEYPEVWAMQQLSAMLAAATAIDAPDSKR